MKKLGNCVVENCIPTPASCVEWNGGDIKFLGICNGDFLPNVIWEIVSKLEQLAGENISDFDIDEMLNICNKKAPTEITLVNILTLLKENDTCLKDYIDILFAKIAELAKEQSVDVSLKCFADFDNLGNSLSVTRPTLDQLVVDKLCLHKGQIEDAQSKLIGLQEQISSIEANRTVDELSFATAINPVIAPTSVQVIKTSQALFDLREATGDETAIGAAISKTPTAWKQKFGSIIVGWDNDVANFSENYGNLLLLVAKLEQRVSLIESTCCAPTCNKIKIGIQFVVNDDDTVDMVFSSGSGTYIPQGFRDTGTIVTFEDTDGRTFSPNITATPITQEGTIPNVNISTLSSGLIKVNFKTKFSLFDEFGTLVFICQDCFSTEFVNTSGCCVITNTGATQTIIYKTTI